MSIGWKYKSGERVCVGDVVRISKRWAKEHGADTGEVTRLSGFVSVILTNGSVVDFDMRSLTFVERRNTNR